MLSLQSPPLRLAVCVAMSMSLAAACSRRAAEEAPAHAEEGHDDEHEGAPTEVELSEEAFKRAGIRDEAVQDTGSGQVLLAPASLETNADRIARVGPRVAGRVQRVIVRLGDRVPAGAALATILSPQAAEAGSALDSARAARQLAERALARERELLQRRVAAQREVLEAEAALARATADVEAAEARMTAMGFSTPASGAAGREPVVTITSPIAGTVIDRTIAVDAPVGPDSVLFTVADLSTLWLTVKVPEAQAGVAKGGQTIRVSVNGQPDRPLSGRIDYISPLANADTRTVDVRIQLPNPGGALRPGMSATARLDLPAGPASSPDASRVLVPRTAVQDLNQTPVVFVPDGERKYRIQPVALGASYGSDVEIVTGLKPGDRVVVQGAFTLKAQALRGAVADPH